MGITNFFSDVWDTFSHPSPDAEAPPQGGTSTDTPASGTNEESKEEADVNKKDEASKGEGEQGHRPSGKGDKSDDADEAADEPEEEEEEEEEELADPKESLEKGE
jgi:ubiquinol-cytochrome c reductase subunit 6